MMVNSVVDVLGILFLILIVVGVIYALSKTPNATDMASVQDVKILNMSQDKNNDLFVVVATIQDDNTLAYKFITVKNQTFKDFLFNAIEVVEQGYGKKN